MVKINKELVLDTLALAREHIPMSDFANHKRHARVLDIILEWYKDTDEESIDEIFNA